MVLSLEDRALLASGVITSFDAGRSLAPGRSIATGIPVTADETDKELDYGAAAP